MFKVILNHKPTKAKCAAIGRSNVVRRSLPLDQNGFVLTGLDDLAPYPEYPYLVILDLDATFIRPQYINLPNTFSVRTGGGGRHYYYWTNHPISNSQKKPITQHAKTVGLNGFDVRGDGGIIFAPGCRFTDHEMSYQLLPGSTDSPVCLSSTQLQKWIHKYIWEPSDPYKKMREGFRSLMNGDWNLAHDMNKTTGIDEWLYWSAFWREYLNCGGTVKDGVTHFNTTGLQRTFNEEETVRQLETSFFQKLGDKRPSNDFYFRLFPDLEDELKAVASHTNVDEVITKLMVRLGKLETDMETVIHYMEGGKRLRPMR